MTAMTLGFVGLGDQGGPMAEMILRAGWPMKVYARRPEVSARYTEFGAEVVESLTDLASADLVGVCVKDEAQVRDVLFGDAPLVPAMRPASIVAVHSTIPPGPCRELAQEAARYNVRVIDAPVSGGHDAPYKRELAVMVGGDKSAFDAARPVFETFGNPVAHMGEVGSGEITKIINNYLYAAQLGLARDAVALAKATGIEWSGAVDVWCESSSASWSLNRYRELGFPPALIRAPQGGLRNSLGIMKYNMNAARELARQIDCEFPEWDAQVQRTLELISSTLPDCQCERRPPARSGSSE
jgi:3-hydroxyisobutyrate dehydrogenase